MADMKTLTINGTKYVVVDGDAREAIGTADISNIGDGTIRGAINALFAMINSGGGSASSFTVEVGEESDYAESEYIDLAKDNYAYPVSIEVPTLEQMENCVLTAVFDIAEEATTVIFKTPVVDDNNGEYHIRFSIIDGVGIDTSGLPCLVILEEDNGYEAEPGIYLCFDGIKEAVANLDTDGYLHSGKITFPEV